MNKNNPKEILVVAAHPDDEILGCGGTIVKHLQEGDNVHVVILAEGITSRSENRDRDKQANALSEIAGSEESAHKILGTTSLELFDLPDNRMDSLDRIDVTKKIEKLIEQYQAEIIYTHHAGDVNIDHRIIHEAVVTACRPQPGHCVKTLLFFEVASSTEWQTPCSNIAFTPNWFIDISATLDKKLQALEAYESEMRKFPHPRSIEALNHLAKWRGASVGLDAAEAFMLGRQISYTQAYFKRD